MKMYLFILFVCCQINIDSWYVTKQSRKTSVRIFLKKSRLNINKLKQPITNQHCHNTRTNYNKSDNEQWIKLIIMNQMIYPELNQYQ